MIVKVQWPLMSTHDNPGCLVYDKERKNQFIIPCDKVVKAAMKNSLKRFFHAEFNEITKKVEINWSKPAPMQEW